MAPSRAARERMGLASIIAVVVAGHVWWILRHRTTLGIDQDEAQLHGWTEEVRAAAATGPLELAQAWAGHRTSAPLLGLVSAPLAAVADRAPLALLAPQVISLVVLVVAVWWITHQLGGRQWSLLAALAVSVAPGIVWFTRVNHQILPGAAALCLCVAVGLRADAFRNRRWSLVLGVTVGVALLTRTMLIVSAPMAIGAWGVAALGPTRFTRRQWGNAARSLVSAVAVAATWWAFTLPAAVDHLVYGSAERHGGLAPPREMLEEEYLAARAIVTGFTYYASARRILLVLAVTLAVALIRRAMQRRALLVERERYVLVVLAWTLLGLVISHDDFPGYPTLVVPLAIAWVVARAVAEPPVIRAVLLTGMTGLAAIGSLTFLASDASWYQRDLLLRHESLQTDPVGEQWGDAYAWAATRAAIDGPPECPTGVVVVQPEGTLTSAHLRWAASHVLPRGRIEATQLEQRLSRTSLRESLAALDGSGSWLVTVDPTEGSDLAPLDGTTVEEEVRRQRYRTAGTRHLPDGTTMTLWAPRDARSTCRDTDEGPGP